VAAAIFALLPEPNTNETNNYVRPDANVVDNADRVTVGQIRSLSGDPRLMQFSARFQS
jgi:hypothetical protein